MSERGAGTTIESAQTVRLELSRDEIAVLERVTHYYERSMGLTRHVLRITGGDEIKAKYQFIVDEANSLDLVVQSVLAQVQNVETRAIALNLTPRAVIAFWGRLLSSLNIPRSRRKLRHGEAEMRTALAEKLGGAIRLLYLENPRLVLQEIATRRAREAEWMSDYLAAKDT